MDMKYKRTSGFTSRSMGDVREMQSIYTIDGEYSPEGLTSGEVAALGGETDLPPLVRRQTNETLTISCEGKTLSRERF